jgi:hypothetical protein
MRHFVRGVLALVSDVLIQFRDLFPVLLAVLLSFGFRDSCR